MRTTLAILAASLLLLMSNAYADGLMYPTKFVRPLSIPYQVASIDFNGHRETMTIWNVIGAENKKFVKCVEGYLRFDYGSQFYTSPRNTYATIEQSPCKEDLNYKSAMWIIPVCGKNPEINILKAPQTPILDAPQRSTQDGIKTALEIAVMPYIPFYTGIELAKTLLLPGGGLMGTASPKNTAYTILRSARKYGVTVNLMQVKNIGSFTDTLRKQGYTINPDVLRSYVDRNCYIATIEVNLLAAPEGCASIKRKGYVLTTYCGIMPTIEISFDRNNPWYPVEMTAKSENFKLLLVTSSKYTPNVKYDEMLFGNGEIGYQISVKGGAKDITLRKSTTIDKISQKIARKYSVDDLSLLIYLIVLAINIVVAYIIRSRRKDQARFWYIYAFPILNQIILAPIFIIGSLATMLILLVSAYIVEEFFEIGGMAAAVIAMIGLIASYAAATIFIVKRAKKHSDKIKSRITELRSVDIRLFLISATITILGALAIYTAI